jgi:hypothetical protein
MFPPPARQVVPAASTKLWRGDALAAAPTVLGSSWLTGGPYKNLYTNGA